MNFIPIQEAIWKCVYYYAAVLCSKREVMGITQQV